MIVMLPCSRCGEMFRPKMYTQHRCASCIKAQPNHRPLPRFCKCGKQITRQRCRYCNTCIDEKQKRGLEIGYQKIHRLHYQRHHKITTPSQPLRERINVYRDSLISRFPVINSICFDDIYNKIMENWKTIHINPKIMSAAIFYIATMKSSAKIPQSCISDTMGVCATSLRKWYHIFREILK